MEKQSTTSNQDSSENSGSKRSERIKSIISSLVLFGSGVTIATYGPDSYEKIKGEYMFMVDLRTRASELLGAEQALNELKKYPGASIRFDKKTNSWSVVFPPKENLIKNSTPISPRKIGSNFSANIPIIPYNIQENPILDFSDFNRNQLSPKEVEASNIIGDRLSYSSYLLNMSEELRLKMPTFETLKEKLGLTNGDEIKLLIGDNSEVWVYGSIQKNDIGQEYRLRKAIINLKDRTIDNGFINNFYYLLEK